MLETQNRIDRGQPEDAADQGSIAAVVMTFNRRASLRRWIECIRQQTIAPDEVIVVDNGSLDGSVEMLQAEYPEVRLVSLGENLGPSAAAAEGIRTACELGFDWIWVFDDDAFPAPSALENALLVTRTVKEPSLGMVWLPFSDFGGWAWRGRKVPVSLREQSRAANGPYRVDQVDLNMTLISRRVVERVGYPQPDFFIMLWSCDYCLRVARAGFSIWVAPTVTVKHEHAGSDSSGVWRSYYQTRNQLVMALRDRSPSQFFWWLIRQGRFIAGTLLKHDRKWLRIRLRLRGAFDGLRGVMGKIVDPMDYR